MTDRSNLIQCIDRMADARVLVIGDVMLDRYVYGEVSRISPEAPVPVLRSGETRLVLGGAGNVVRNLITLGSRAYFVSTVGDDSEAQEIRSILSKYDEIESNLIVDRQRKTTVKTRYMADRQQILRVDNETPRDLDENLRKMALQAVRDFVTHCDVIVLSDYGKGFLSRNMLHDVIDLCKQSGKPLLVDPKGTDYNQYMGASILTPNLKELKEATGMPVSSNDLVVAAANKLIGSCELDAVLVTRSAEGMTVVQSSGEVICLKAEAKEVFDVSGAGDTVIATAAAAYGSGASLAEAAELANVAAGIVVGKVGTAAIYTKDLIRALHNQALSSAEAKILDLITAVDIVERWRRKGYKIGFTNGVFDLLHPGHLSLLSQASKQSDRLIVGLNSDLSVRRLKGIDPVQHEAARSAILASLEIVDMVVIYQEHTPVNLLDALRPDVLVKGANYTADEVVGANLVTSYGGEIVLVDIEEIRYTNSTIERITNGTF